MLKRADNGIKYTSEYLYSMFVPNNGAQFMELTKIWVTKYALTGGIFEAEAKIDEDGWAKIPHDHERGLFTQYFRGNDWHRTVEEAMKRAEGMRVKKIASLKKQIKKLEELKF